MSSHTPRKDIDGKKRRKSDLNRPTEKASGILEEEGGVEARCQFCGTVYRFGPEEVEKRFREARGDASKDEDFKVLEEKGEN